MSKPPSYWHKAKKILSKRDPVLRRLIKKYPRTSLSTRNTPFISLVRICLSQQISTKASDAIWFKFKKICKNKINPKKISELSTAKLKSAGLSRQKVKYLKNLAKSFKNKSFDPKKLKYMNSEEITDYISQLKGYSVWSSNMYKIFSLNLPDCFPTTDIGVLRSLSVNYKTKYPPSRKFLEKISKKYSGYRSVATIFLWRSLDPGEVEY